MYFFYILFFLSISEVDFSCNETIVSSFFFGFVFVIPIKIQIVFCGYKLCMILVLFSIHNQYPFLFYPIRFFFYVYVEAAVASL